MHVCLDRAACPVADYRSVAAAPLHVVPANTSWWRVYDSTYGFDEPNPGPKGHTRFAPIFRPDGSSIPTMYIAEHDVGALLEVVFRFVDPPAGGDPNPPAALAYESTFHPNLLVEIAHPMQLQLLDLRDPVLERLKVPRVGVASCGRRHYGCTQQLAQDIYAARDDVAGIVWHSRQAELHQALGHAVPDEEVAVVFTDRVPLGRGGWLRLSPGPMNLTTGAGRTRLDVVATSLNIDIVTG